MLNFIAMLFVNCFMINVYVHLLLAFGMSSNNTI